MKLVRQLRGCVVLGFSCVLFVNVFIAKEELWEGFETAMHLPCVGLLGCFMQLLQIEEHERCQIFF